MLPETPMSPSEKLIELIEHSDGIEVGLTAHQLRSGEEILSNPDVSFHPATKLKFYVMLEAFHQAWQGLFSLNVSILIKNEFTSIADE